MGTSERSGKDLASRQKVTYIGRHLMIQGKYLDLILSGKKVTTIRYGIVKPKFQEVIIHSAGKVIGKAIIKRVVYKKVKDLTDEDAQKDGFSNKQELVRELKKTYPDLRFSDYVTIIEFELVQRFDNVSDYDVYCGLNPLDVARIALRYNIGLTDEEKSLLRELLAKKSIRKLAIEKFGSLNKRWIIRKVLRKALRLLIEKGVLSTSTRTST